MHQTHAVPVKEGDEIVVKIDAVGAKGDGIARVDGFVLFVSNTQKGDNVKVRITKVLEKVGFAQVLEKVEKPKREEHHAPEQVEEEPDVEPVHYEDTEDFGEE